MSSWPWRLGHAGAFRPCLGGPLGAGAPEGAPPPLAVHAAPDGAAREGAGRLLGAVSPPGGRFGTPQRPFWLAATAVALAVMALSTAAAALL
jgi:hypothetical protein